MDFLTLISMCLLVFVFPAVPGDLHGPFGYHRGPVDLRWNIKIYVNDSRPSFDANRTLYLTEGETTSLRCEFAQNRTSPPGKNIFPISGGRLFCDYMRLDQPPVCSKDRSKRSLQCSSTLTFKSPIYYEGLSRCCCKLYVPGGSVALFCPFIKFSLPDKGSDVTSTPVDLGWNIKFFLNETLQNENETIFMTADETTRLRCEFTTNRTSPAGNDIFYKPPQGNLLCSFMLAKPAVCSMDSSHRSLYCHSTGTPFTSPLLYKKKHRVCFCYLNVPGAGETSSTHVIKFSRTYKRSDVTITASTDGITTTTAFSTTLSNNAFSSSNNNSNINSNNNTNKTSQEQLSQENHAKNHGDLKSRDRNPSTPVHMRWNIQFYYNETRSNAEETLVLTAGETTRVRCNFSLNDTSTEKHIFYAIPEPHLSCTLHQDQPQVCSTDSPDLSQICRSTLTPPLAQVGQEDTKCCCHLMAPGVGHSELCHRIEVSLTDKGSDVTSTALTGGVTLTNVSSITHPNNEFVSNNNSNNRNNNDNNNNGNNNNETSQEQLSNENHDSFQDMDVLAPILYVVIAVGIVAAVTTLVVVMVRRRSGNSSNETSSKPLNSVIYSSGQAGVCIDSREDLVDHLDTFWSGNEPFDLDLDPMTDISQPTTSENKERDN